MKKQTVKSILIGILVWWSVLAVSAYNTQIWSPIQFVKQLFVTPNGESDANKATIKIDGTNGIIEAKNVKVNWQDVATKNYVDNKVKNIDTSNLTVKNLKTANGKYLIKNGKIQWVSLTKTIQDYAGWRRWSDGTYARSCNGYRHPQAGYKYAWSIWDGVYWINPDGVSSAFKVYCDMTTDGGGWTLVVRWIAWSYWHRNAWAVWEFEWLWQSKVFKLSDEIINKIPKTMYRAVNDDFSSKIYFDTSDNFSSLRQVNNKTKPTYEWTTWYWPYYDSNHFWLNNFKQGVWCYWNEVNWDCFTYTDASTSWCRKWFGIKPWHWCWAWANWYLFVK